MQRLDERVRLLCRVRASPCARCRSPTRARTRSRAARGAGVPTTWRSSTASVSPASRSASVSPTHAMTARPASSAASARRRTVSSVSQKCCRRSECPTSAPVTPSSSEHRRRDLAREGALELPVHVLRVDADARVLAEPLERRLERRRTAGRRRRRPRARARRRRRICAANSRAWCAPLNIFQFPATSIGRRS